MRLMAKTDERVHDGGIEERRHLSVRWQDNWYRDVWNFLNTLLMLGILVLGVATNEDRINDVQKSRYEFQLQNCQVANARNLSAKAEGGRLPLSPQGKITVIKLVDKLQPFTRDCEARAREGVEIPPD
jgi:hypothetical protein